MPPQTLEDLHHKNAGISLLEISVAMMIMGVVAAGSIPLYLNHRTQQAHVLTEKRQDFVMMALAQHVLMYKSLPCPASDLKGVAPSNCGTEPVCVGYVPFRTLGIPQDYRMDGYNRPWMYGVWQKLTPQDKASKNNPMEHFFSAQGNTLTLYDRDNQKIDHDQDPIALVLISHPPLESSVDPLQCVEKPYTFQQEGYPPVHVFWITRRHLMRHYGGYSWNPEFSPQPQPENKAVEKQPEPVEQRLDQELFHAPDYVEH